MTDDLGQDEELRQRWQQVAPNTPLVTVEAPNGSFAGAVAAYVDEHHGDPDQFFALVMPERIPAHLWETLLHNWYSRRLSRAFKRRANTVVIEVPYRLPA